MVNPAWHNAHRRSLARSVGALVLAAILCTAPWSDGATAASRAPVLVAASSASSGDRQRAASALATSVRDFRSSADLAVRRPANAFTRIGFKASTALLKASISRARAVGGLTQSANLAQLVLQRETRRVQAAWDRVEDKARVDAVVRQLDALTRDAARSSGAQTASEINAFSRAHLADVRYAGRRWLVDKAVGRQGAVFISRGVRNPPLRRAVEQLYRYGAKTGDGGTADKLLAEVQAGCRRGACQHFIKAGERRRNLLTILSEQRLSPTEREIAGELIGALTKSIRAAGGK